MRFDFLRKAPELVERDAAPEPTPAPPPELVAKRLYARQLDATQTCGYITGDPLTPVYCDDGAQCAQNTYYNARGCCFGDIASCTLPTACLDMVEVSCTANCSINDMTRSCTDAASPYCGVRFWETSGEAQVQSEFGCESTPGSTAYAAPTSTTVGEDVLFTSATVGGGINPEFSSASPTLFVPTSSGQSTVFPISSSAPVISTTDIFPSAAASSTISNSNNGSGGSGSGLSQGATIAIAVCATIVGLALIGLAGVCLWWKRRNAPGGSHGPPMVQHAQILPPPEHPPYDDDPDGEAAFARNAGIEGFTGRNAASAAPGSTVGGSGLDDDQLDKLRRFSGEGTVVTVDQTVAGRTDDGFRPQAA